MKIINALKRLMNKGIQVQKDEEKNSDNYSFEKGSLVFCFTNLTDEDTAIHFHAWDKETQETFYFKNFKNMMIYFDGVQEVQKVESVQEVKPKSKEVKGETPEIINKIENAQPDKWIAEIIQVKNDKFSVQLNEEGSYVSDGYSSIAIFDTPEDAIKGCSHLNNKWNIYNPFKEKVKPEPAVDAQPEYTPAFIFDEIENDHQKAIKDLDKIINAFKESREDQEVEIIEENKWFFIRLLMNKVSEIQIRLLISMHINMINLGEYDEIEYNEDEEKYTLEQVYDFIKESEMIIDYCETFEVNEEYFTKREKEVFNYALSLLKRPESFGTCNCYGDIIKSDSIANKEYICNCCGCYFDKDEWSSIQEVICEAESGPVESENEVQNAERLI